MNIISIVRTRTGEHLQNSIQTNMGGIMRGAVSETRRKEWVIHTCGCGEKSRQDVAWGTCFPR